MSYLSGMRVAEIASLRISHVLDAFEEIANLNELVINELEVEELDFDDY